MLQLILLLLVLGIVAFAAGLIREQRLKRQLEKGEIQEMPTLKQVEDMECCGQHEVCEKDSLLAAVSRDIEYYEDEELDRFRGRAGSEYSEDECEEFREILYTMKEDEVAGWTRSLQLRGIEVPDGVKDELLLVVRERRVSR